MSRLIEPGPVEQRRQAIAARLADITERASGWKTDADIDAFFERLLEVNRLARAWANARMAYGRATAETVETSLREALDTEKALFDAVWNGSSK